MTLGELLTANIKVTKHYPYRTAMVYHDNNMVMNDVYEHGKPVDRLHHHVASQVARNPDNHECYKIEIGGKTYYLMFSDWRYTVSTTIQEGSW